MIEEAKHVSRRMRRQPRGRRFSWLKALPWVVLSVPSALFVVMIAAGVMGSAYYHALGERSAVLVVVGAPLGSLIISYQWQLAGARTGLRAGAWVALVVLLWIAYIVGSHKPS